MALMMVAVMTVMTQQAFSRHSAGTQQEAFTSSSMADSGRVASWIRRVPPKEEIAAKTDVTCLDIVRGANTGRGTRPCGRRRSAL